jgi:two-component system, NarL family, sensor histidine kinase DesK
VPDVSTARSVWSPFLEVPGRDWRGPGRGWWLYAGVWLVYLLAPLGAVLQRTTGWQTAVGVTAVLAFAVMYVVLLPRGFRLAHRRVALVTPLLLLALAVLLMPLAGEQSLACLVFVAVAFLVAYPRPWSFLAVGGVVVLAGTLPYVVPGWSDDGVQQAVQIGLTAVIVLVVMQLLRANRALREAQEELAHLAVVEERERVARDIHDVLGHSLTVITKKAELARRLAEVDPPRAAAEIAEVEVLAREALQDVRSTVTGYRRTSLEGELVTARVALASAGIAAELPGGEDGVPAEYRVLFGWAVREGVTNVVRHSHARTCRVELTRSSVAVLDDGDGDGAAVPADDAPDAGGHGLRGLRERVVRAGGELRAGARTGGGFELRVEMPDAPGGEE